MDRLYEALAAGQPPAEALRTAKLGLMRAGGPYRKPIYWAAFETFTLLRGVVYTCAEGSLGCMLSRSSVLFVSVCFGADAADFAIGGGAGRAAGDARTYPTGGDAQPDIGGTLLLNAGFDFLHFKGAVIGVEVPLAVLGSRSSDVFTRGSYAGFYTERLSVTLTPGVRVRFESERRLSPWVSFGAGLTRVRRTGVDYQASQYSAAQKDTNLKMALAPAAGIDIRLTPHWFLRGELRNYLYQTPATGFVSSFGFWNRWNYNPVVAGSMGFRF